MKGIYGLAGVLLLAAAGFAQENYSTTWTQHKDMYIHTGASRANVPGAVTNFPMLVRLNSTNFGTGFAQAKGNGADIRFTKAGNVVRFKHQIETWDSAGKTATIWVLIDTVKGNLNNQLFRMHWGNAAAADSSKGSAVFDTANGFVGVWHLNETTAAAGNLVNDATVNANDGKLGLQGTGAAPTNTTAMIGVGKTFGGDAANTNTNGAYYSIKDSSTAALASLNTVTGPITITAWSNPDVCATGTRITVISKYDNTNTTGTRAWALQTSATAASWRFTVDPNQADFQAATAGNEFVADNTCTVGQWDYLVGRYNATAPIVNDATSVTMGLALNGDAVNEAVAATASQATGASIGPNGIAFIGRLMSPANANNRFMRGSVDEITVSKVRRSNDWIKLSYETQKAGSTAVSDAVVALLPGNASSAGFTVSQAANGLQFRLPTNAGGNAVLTVADMKGRTVWSRTVSTGSDESVVSWNGVSDAGAKASAGLYAVTVSLRDASGASVRNLSQKVSFAP